MAGNLKKIFFLFSLLFFICILSACGAAKKPAAPAPDAVLNLTAVAQHNTIDDCWLVDNNNIYNVTDYLADHPEEEAAIVPECGKDATINFSTKETGLGAGHSDSARQDLEQYYVGSLAR